MKLGTIISFIAISLILAGSLCWLILTRPDNFILKMARAPLSTPNAKIITGPYPLESDFKTLKNLKISTIVSLLNPAIPYENSLLEQEKLMAKTFKIELLSFPMSSILGQKFGDAYQSNAEAAAEAIARAPGKVYLHCYLGLHRSVAVLDLLKDKKINADISTYSKRQAERSQEALLSDEIDLAFANGNYSRVLELIPEQGNYPFDKAMLRNWSLYRTARFAEAKAGFTSALIDSPEQPEAILGAAYSSMQLEDLISAEQLFTRAVQLSPTNSDAWAGLGLIHFRLNNFPKARSDLQRAVELNPHNAEALDVLKKLDEDHSG